MRFQAAILAVAFACVLSTADAWPSLRGKKQGTVDQDNVGQTDSDNGHYAFDDSVAPHPTHGGPKDKENPPFPKHIDKATPKLKEEEEDSEEDPVEEEKNKKLKNLLTDLGKMVDKEKKTRNDEDDTQEEDVEEEKEKKAKQFVDLLGINENDLDEHVWTHEDIVGSDGENDATDGDTEDDEDDIESESDEMDTEIDTLLEDLEDIEDEDEKEKKAKKLVDQLGIKEKDLDENRWPAEDILDSDVGVGDGVDDFTDEDEFDEEESFPEEDEEMAAELKRAEALVNKEKAKVAEIRQKLGGVDDTDNGDEEDTEESELKREKAMIEKEKAMVEKEKAKLAVLQQKRGSRGNDYSEEDEDDTDEDDLDIEDEIIKAKKLDDKYLKILEQDAEENEESFSYDFDEDIDGVESEEGDVSLMSESLEDLLDNLEQDEESIEPGEEDTDEEFSSTQKEAMDEALDELKQERKSDGNMDKDRAEVMDKAVEELRQGLKEQRETGRKGGRGGKDEDEQS